MKMCIHCEVKPARFHTRWQRYGDYCSTRCEQRAWRERNVDRDGVKYSTRAMRDKKPKEESPTHSG